MEITEQKILHAAKKMFLTEGYNKTTTAALAKHAGVNKAAIHYYFSDKKTLYQLVVREAIDEEVVLTLDSLNKDIPFYFKIKVFEDFRDLLITKYPHLPIVLIDKNEPGHNLAMESLKNSGLNLAGFESELKYYTQHLPLQIDEPKAVIAFLLSIAIFPHLFKDILKLFLNIDDKKYKSNIDEHMDKLLYFINNNPIKA